jgi:hypothetical protein
MRAGRVGVLADVRALADLLEDVLLLAERRAVEHLDLQGALGALLDRLGPVLEARVVGLLGAEHMVELERVLRGGERAAEAQGEGDDDSHGFLLFAVRLVSRA